MALMITWRNPCPVQTAQPRKKLSDHASESIHIVQKGISRAQSRQGVDMPFLNVLCGVPLGASPWSSQGGITWHTKQTTEAGSRLSNSTAGLDFRQGYDGRWRSSELSSSGRR